MGASRGKDRSFGKCDGITEKGDEVMLKIYTKTGDSGQTSLYDQTRINKEDIRVESYGTIDELNSSLGLAKTFINDKEIYRLIERVQRELFNVAGELAMLDGSAFPDRIAEEHVTFLEQTIDAYLDQIGREQVFRFILPGSNSASGALHVSRTVCRRAERRILALAREHTISPVLLKYVNRLADFIYTLARFMEENPQFVEFKK